MDVPYDHDKPYQPRWDGLERFRGLLVHPQRWPRDLDVAGKRVIVIGSGATAATLRDLDVPAKWTHEILRRAYIARSDELVKAAFERPEDLHRFLIESMRPQLPGDFGIARHFTPRYRPWQQRSGIVPDGTRERYDAVCLDIGNGPGWTVTDDNRSVYGPGGLDAVDRVLAAKGVLAAWSAAPAAEFTRLLASRFARVETLGIPLPPGRRGEPDVVILASRVTPARSPAVYVHI